MILGELNADNFEENSSCNNMPFLYSWMQIIGDHISARVITLPHTKCPNITIDSENYHMNIRATVQNVNMDNFTVCEKDIVDTPNEVYINGLSLPIPSKELYSFITIGDTGFIDTISKSEKSNFCEPSNKNIRIFNSIIKQKPDFVIHMGDYTYNHNHYIKSFNLSANKELTQVSALLKEFFEPAQELLSKVPMVFVRGNHDNCRRGNAWAAFFGTSEHNMSECILSTEPYIINNDKVNFIILDTANTPYGTLKYSNEQIQEYKNNFSKYINPLKFNQTFLCLHQPLIDLEDFSDLKHPITRKSPFINEVFASYINSSMIAISGHYHLAANLKMGNFTQIISGNGGFELAEADKTYYQYSDSKNLHGDIYLNYGFHKFSKTSLGWNIFAYDSEGKQLS